jgi:hypothetical protein
MNNQKEVRAALSSVNDSIEAKLGVPRRQQHKEIDERFLREIDKKFLETK